MSVTVVAFTSTQALGAFGVVFGLVLLLGAKRIADFFAAIQVAEAKFVERRLPARGKETISIWLRVGTGDDAESKVYRYGVIILLGCIALVAGIAALLGAWSDASF